MGLYTTRGPAKATLKGEPAERKQNIFYRRYRLCKNMKAMKINLLALLLLPAMLLAQGNDDSPIPVDPAVRQGVLPNGLRYFIRANAKPEDRAELRLVVKAGSLLEDADQLGLAHFVEHMAFNGSRHFAKNELVDYLESVGSRFGPDLNAYTSFEETVYMLQARTDSLALLEKGLLILEDWADGLLFDPEEVDKERGVVVSEWRSRLSAEQRMQQQYYPLLYRGSRYAERLPIGDPAIIDSADYATIERFYRDWYRPDLMAIVVVGDVDVEWVEAQIQARFRRLSPPEQLRPRPSYTVPAHEETLIKVVSDPEASFTQVRLIYKQPATADNNRQAMRQELVQALFNQMMNARLVDIREQADPPFTFASLGYGSDVGDLAIYSGYVFVREGGALRGLETLLRENKRVREHGFQASELARAKAQLLERAERTAREADKLPSAVFAGQLVAAFLDEEAFPSAEQRLALYQQWLPDIDLAEVNTLPAQWIKDSNRVLIVSGPEKATAPLPTEAELRAIVDSMEQVAVAPYEDRTSNQPLLAATLSPVAITDSLHYAGNDVSRWTLANGVTVVFKPTDFQNEQVLMTAFSEGGTGRYELEDFRQIKWATQLVEAMGLSHFSPSELYKQLVGKTVSVGPYIAGEYEGLQGSATPDDLETLFQLVYLYFTAPRYDDTLARAFIQQQAGIYENIEANPDFYYHRRLNEILYGNNPRVGLPTSAQMEAVDPRRAFALYQERFADASDFTFVFVGSFTPAQLRSLATRYLGNLPTSLREDQRQDDGVRLRDTTLAEIISRGQTPRSRVQIVWHGSFAWSDTNRYAFSSLLDVLRIKLRESLREELGGVYGVRLYGNTEDFPRPQYRITLTFTSEPARTAELIAAARDVIRKLAAEGPALTDLQKIKETQRQAMIKGWRENSFWLSSLEQSAKRKTDPDRISLERLTGFQHALSEEKLRQMAAALFDQHELQVVLMPREEEP